MRLNSVTFDYIVIYMIKTTGEFLQVNYSSHELDTDAVIDDFIKTQKVDRSLVRIVAVVDFSVEEVIINED